MCSIDCTAIYRSDEYVAKHPDLFAQDADWKIEKLTPLIDIWLSHVAPSEGRLGVLDIGGGAGLILRGLCDHIAGRHNRPVTKYALDLSRAMLLRQRQVNPDLHKTLNEDVRHSSLADKQIDLALMIDVLEHVPAPAEALAEVSRFARSCILKVPLEDNLALRLANVKNRGRTARTLASELGHINLFNARSLRRLIEAHLGSILHFSFADAFGYMTHCSRQGRPLRRADRIANGLCARLHKYSPGLASRLFTDFALVLVRCH